MTKQNYHHEYHFAPIFGAVVIYAIIPVALITAMILHPIYTIGIFAAYCGVLTLIEKEMKRIERRKLLVGKAQMFRGICFSDGSQLTDGVFGLLFGIYQLPLFLNSFQGPIALIHGCASYRKGFWNGEKQITTREMADLFPKGLVYNLISCHNSYHGNFARDGQLFIRPVCTMNEYPVRFSYEERTNSAIVWSGPEIERALWVYIPMMLYVFPILKAILKHFYPIEVLLYNGKGDRRKQQEAEMNRLFEKWRKDFGENSPF